MHFKRRVKAGVLLYALLMASVFLLLLQAYLSHISQLHQEYQAQMDYAKAQLIAEMVYQEQPSGDGQIAFNCGQVSYKSHKQRFIIEIKLPHQQLYQFSYPEVQQASQTSKKQSELKQSLP
ncbi:competence type IV pilus minor pilin ComGG [Streptococcus equi]|uniref:Putative exported protein n=2 Tax=Streptococcus equi TaxID=1336 RepID=C0MBI4_STRE4|nr:competence type IV pilus minor pilin ComGG [Streptococcus equi]ASB95765.1 hypothetical protein SE071780_00144 [Streptococcus equi subsp. equi]MBT1194134.1 competence protein ComG [Streptococcus equi subsp. equi]MBT1197189.1 competence protein ComG [Streptococcus equi subsp. equi]MBT1200205.1 competence protein ComG [Streptococcus equi subsp. equi]MBT1201754.1 competence protein ComG [Streptococcus equi subsp. equi]